MKKVLLPAIFAGLILTAIVLSRKSIGLESPFTATVETGENEMSSSDLSDEEAIAIARRSFAESPLSDTPSPIVRREEGKTVVFLPRWLRPDAPPREFPKDWLPVWIDDSERTVVPSPSSVLSEKEALEIAKRAIGDIAYDKNGTIKIERNSVCFVFTFPEPRHGEPGTYLGPDFAVKVGVDSETKEILFICAGG